MEQKNLILAVLLSTVILIGWSYFFEAPSQHTLQETQGNTGEDQLGAPQGALQQTPQAISSGGQTEAYNDPEMINFAGKIIQPRETILSQTPRIVIDTPRLRGSINLIGAKFDDLALTDYRDSLEEDAENIILLSPNGSQHPYFSRTGWMSNDLPADQLPGPETKWVADQQRLTPTSPVNLQWENGNGLRFRQQISIDSEYLITVTKSVENASSAAVTIAEFALVQRAGTPDILDFYILHEGLIGVFDETLKELDYSDIQDEGTIQQKSTGGWLGITDKYWLVGLIPDQNARIHSSFKAVRNGNDYRYQADYANGSVLIPAGQTHQSQSYIFAGAKRTTLLDQYSEEKGIANFDLAVDFGWFYFLTKPIFLAIHWLNGVLGNFGLAILALTVGIKILLFPLANKSYVSMSRMKLLQPKMMEIKERFGDDRQKLNMEMMALYKKEKVNPLAGCLPILIQIPVFFSLYKVLFVTIEMRHAPFYGWIEDLSAKDPLGLLTLFGLAPWQVPATLEMVNIGIWPLIMGLTMWCQQKLNPAPADPIQQKVFALMPILFTFLLATFPAGLVIYWAWNNSLSILQQWIIMRRVGAEQPKAKT